MSARVDRQVGGLHLRLATGEIRVLDASKLSYEKSKAIKLAFAVADNGIPGNTKPLVVKATVVVALTDRNEAPVISSVNAFSLKENNKADAKVGQVKAKDPDTKVATKDTLSYSIVSQKDASNADVTVFTWIL